MASIAQLYNSLLPLEAADEKFVDRDQTLSKLAVLLSNYDNKYGVCLVHRHCALEDGEIMVSDGDVSEPQRDVECYPERWLASGEPYEFSRAQTHSPPEALLEEFRKIVQGVDVLGLFYIHNSIHVNGVISESTEGRRNVTEIIAEELPDSIWTGWVSGPDGYTIRVLCTCNPNNHAKTPSLTGITLTRATNTGSGTRFNDIVDIGEYPLAQRIRKISGIKVWSSSFVEGIEVTYRLASKTFKQRLYKTATHGKTDGKAKLEFSLSGHEFIMGIYGRHNNKTCKIVTIGFVVFDKQIGTVKTKELTTASNGAGPHTYGVFGHVVALAGVKTEERICCLSFAKSEAVDHIF